MYAIRLLVTAKSKPTDVVFVYRNINSLDWSDEIRRDFRDDIADALHDSLIDDAVTELSIYSQF